MIQIAIKGIALTDEKLAMDVIHEVGPGGTYISHEHSLRSMRSQSRTTLFDRRSRSDWMEATKGKTIVESAYETAIDILKNHNPYPLPNDATREMRNIVKEFEKEVKGIKNSG
jgi:trimethylamine--corrinoid protein Co-methyltransferase